MRAKKSLWVLWFLLSATALQSLHAFQGPRIQRQSFWFPTKLLAAGRPTNIADPVVSSTTTLVQGLNSKNAGATTNLVLPDYLIFDSTGEETDTPSLPEFLRSPRNWASLALVGIGGLGVTALNLVGDYGDLYQSLTLYSLAMGALCGLLDVMDDTVSPNVRTGVVDDAVLHQYSGWYTISAAWLCLRISALCPEWLPALDLWISPIAMSVFVFSLAAPVATLLYHHNPKNIRKQLSAPLRTMVNLAPQRRGQEVGDTPPPLTDTELFRAQGLLAIGIVGCLYAPEAAVLTIQGQDWWTRVQQVYPGQPVLEASTALFGIFATQASMVAHRSGKEGVAKFAIVVPAFAMVCILLTIVPCACVLYHLSDQISFFDLYAL